MDAILLVEEVVLWAIRIYGYLILANVILSWIPHDRNNPIIRWIHRATDPVFLLARRALPFLVAGGIDFSPIVVFLLLQLLAQVVAKLFERLAISVG